MVVWANAITAHAYGQQYGQGTNLNQIENVLIKHVERVYGMDNSYIECLEVIKDL